MFTGIIESAGEIKQINASGSNKVFWITSNISAALQIDQSVSHDGVCLTVEELNGNMHRVTAIEETLKKTNLENWKKGGFVNLERSMLMNGRLDGHIVQGHVDTAAVCTYKKESGGSWEYQFEISKKFSHLIIEKGSISLNGISLTIFNVRKKSFRVAIIPYTFEHTNIKNVLPGGSVNIEFDLIGKYIARFNSLNS
jgi:riboflavin synthase